MNATSLELPSQCNCARIRRASRVMTRYYDSLLAPSGLSVNQFTLLGYLRSRGPMSLRELADLLAMDRATIGHNVRPLERDGLLTMKKSREDGRVKLVALTKEGGQRLKGARPLWDEAQRTFERILGKRESAAMRASMDAIADMRTVFESAYEG